MLSLVRSSLFRLIALLVVLLPLSILVSRVYVPYSRSSKLFTFGLSLVQPARSSEFPPVRKFSYRFAFRGTNSIWAVSPCCTSLEICLSERELVSISRSGTSVVGSPSLSADFINQILASASSPAAGTGQGLYDLSMQSGIDDAYALAVFEKESSFGKYGTGFDDHALGNIVCAGYPTCNGRFRWYLSWETGYADFYQLISREYVSCGFSTVETITPVYVPSSENDTGLYIQQVRQSMLAFRQAQSLMP